MDYDSDDRCALAHSSTSASRLEERLDTKKFEKEEIEPFSFELCYTSEELEQMACSPQQRNNVYAEKHDTQWCICQYCVKDVQIVEKVCCKNPSILSIETFNEFDCITQSGAFANVSRNKDVLEAAIGAWRDLSVTHTDLLNINYRFIAYKKYVS